MFELGLFAKFWEPGKVKTRLASKTGELAASRIYQVFLHHLLELMADAEILDSHAIVFSPPERKSDFKTMVESDTYCNKARFKLIPQKQVPDLGQRMESYFQQAFRAEPAPVQKAVVIGSDTPDLSLSAFTEVHQLLDDHPVVIGPSTDGGYYLIAIRKELPKQQEAIFEIFADMPWSTPDVLSITIEKLDQRGIEYALLSPMTDIDHHSDLLDLVARLRRSDDPTHQKLLSALERLNQAGGFLDDE